MIAFIDDHRGVHGIEPICKVLPIAPSTYRSHVAKRADPARLSARARRDATLKIEVRRIFEENFGVCGVRKVWRQLKREGCSICKVNMTISLAFLTTDGVKAAIREPDQLESIRQRPSLPAINFGFNALL